MLQSHGSVVTSISVLSPANTMSPVKASFYKGF